MRLGYRAKVSSKGQVVIPQKLRQEMGLEAGDELEFQLLKDGTFVAQKAEPSTFQEAVAHIQAEMERQGVTEADLLETLEQVKHEMYEERYGRGRKRKQAVS